MFITCHTDNLTFFQVQVTVPHVCTFSYYISSCSRKSWHVTFLYASTCSLRSPFLRQSHRTFLLFVLHSLCYLWSCPLLDFQLSLVSLTLSNVLNICWQLKTLSHRTAIFFIPFFFIFFSFPVAQHVLPSEASTWTFFLCDLTWDLFLKALPHKSHLYGFSPVWVLICALKCALVKKSFVHILHWKARSCTWYLTCSFRKHILKNVLSQNEHLKGAVCWFCVCVAAGWAQCSLRWWLTKFDFQRNARPHVRHVYGVSLVWVLMWSCRWRFT